jgi:pyruvate kinase
MDAGMDTICCNFGTGDHSNHTTAMDNLKSALKQRPNKECATMMITKGPEIRTGLMQDARKVALVAGQALEICNDMSIEGNDLCIACSYKALPESVEVGATILIDDGKIVCEVTEVCEDRVKT